MKNDPIAEPIPAHKTNAMKKRCKNSFSSKKKLFLKNKEMQKTIKY